MRLFLGNVYALLALKILFAITLATRDVEAKAGSGPFSVKAEAGKFHRFRFHI